MNLYRRPPVSGTTSGLDALLPRAGALSLNIQRQYEGSTHLMSIHFSEAVTLDPMPERHVTYLGTIMDQPLHWDDRDGCPWWPEGEPMGWSLDPDGGITQEPLMDINRLPAWAGLKHLDCGDQIRGGDVYATILAAQWDLCLPCAAALTSEVVS